MYKRHFSQYQIAGFAWNQPAVRDVILNLSTRLSRRAIHTPRTSFIPRRLLDMVTTGDDQAVEIWDHLSRPVTRSASYSDLHRESGSCAEIPIEPLYPPQFAHGLSRPLSLNRNTLVSLHHLDNCIGFCMFLCVIGFPGIWSVDSCCVRLVSLPYVARSLVVHGAMCAEMLMNSPNYESTLSLVHLSTM